MCCQLVTFLSVHIYMYVCMYVCIYVYIFLDRKKRVYLNMPKRRRTKVHTMCTIATQANDGEIKQKKTPSLLSSTTLQNQSLQKNSPDPLYTILTQPKNKDIKSDLFAWSDCLISLNPSCFFLSKESKTNTRGQPSKLFSTSFQ